MRTRIAGVAVAAGALLAPQPSPAAGVEECRNVLVARGACAIVTTLGSFDVVVEGVAHAPLSADVRVSVRQLSGEEVAACSASSQTFGIAEARCTGVSERMTNGGALYTALCEARGTYAGLFSCYVVPR